MLLNKKVIVLLLVALSFNGISCQKTAGNNEVVQEQAVKAERVDNSRFTTLLNENEGAQLIDIRTPDEYAAGYIENAVNINFFDSDFKTVIDKLDKSKPIFLYCQSGGRSGKAFKIVKEMGFEAVYELKTGYGGWSK